MAAVEQEWAGDGGDVPDWWRTAIIDMMPGAIRLRGEPIETLIGQVSFAEMIWLMVLGDRPSRAQAALLEVALVAAVDHGPQAPSIATARMAVTCGLGLNGALASAVNLLDDVHGGAGEQAVELYQSVRARVQAGLSLEAAARESIRDWRRDRGRYLPGFGHRFHKPVDPRAPRILGLVEDAAAAGTVSGEYVAIARALRSALKAETGRELALNIDGATAVVYAELGVPAPLARGLFCLSRSVGILAHAWEQFQRQERNKGPTPPRYRWRYDGPNPIPDSERSKQV